MLGISTTNLRVNGFRGKGFDADAQAFITATGITDATQKNAINRLVKNYKGVGDLNNSVDLWSSSKAIYPIVGGTATAHKFNLKDPRDLDAAYRLSFSGGWTHSANGALPNGTNTFANTFFNPSTQLSDNSGRVGIYIRTNVNETKYDIGCSTGASELAVMSRYSDTFYATYGNNATYPTVANTDSRGYFVVNRLSSTITTGYKNGSQVISRAQLESRPNFNIFLGATNNAGTAVGFSSKSFAFCAIGVGLSDANSLIEYNIIQAFQTDLSRQV